MLCVFNKKFVERWVFFGIGVGLMFVDGVFECFVSCEFDCFGCWDFDGFVCFWVVVCMCCVFV